MKMKLIGVIAAICAGVSIILLIVGGSILTNHRSAVEEMLVGGESNVNAQKQLALTSDINRIDIQSFGCSVNISVSSSNDVEASLEGYVSEMGFQRTKLNMSYGSDRIEVSGGLKGVSWFLLKNNLTLNISIPRGYNKEIRLTSHAGEIDIKGLDIDKLKMTVNAGTLNMSENRIERLDADLDAVEGTITGVNNNVKLSINLGNINIALPRFSGNLDFDSNAGDINISLPENLSATISTDINAGNITGDFPQINTGNVSSRKSHSYGGGEQNISISGNLCNYKITKIMQ